MTWFALLAMLFLVCEPTMARVRSLMTGDATMTTLGDVCSVEVMKLVGVDEAVQAESMANAVARHVFDHCEFCHLQPMLTGMAPTVMLGDGVKRLHEAPLIFLQGPRTLTAWQHALSRGPPAVS